MLVAMPKLFRVRIFSKSRPELQSPPSPKLSSKPFFLPLQIILVVPFLLQIFITVGTVGYLSYRNGQRAIKDLVNQLEDRASLQVSEYLDGFLDSSQETINLMGDAVELGIIDLKNHGQVTQYLWRLAQTFPNVTYMNYGEEDGTFIGLGRGYNNTNRLFIEETFPHTLDHLYQFEIVDQGNKGRLYKDKPFADFRRDVWYAQPRQAGKATWTDIYNWIDEPEVMVIGAGRPIFKADKIVAIAGVDLLLSGLDQYVKNLQISPRGSIFIIEKSGYIVASSSHQLPFDIINREAKRRTIEESKDPLIRASGLFLKESFYGFHNIKKVERITFKINNKNHYLQVTPWQDEYGLDWLIGIVVPESDFTAQIEKNNQTTLYLCIISLVIAGILGIYTSRLIMIPIGNLIDKTKAIAAGDLSQKVPHSWIKELDSLSFTFNIMAQQVEESVQSLEQRVEERTEQLKQAERQIWQQEKMSSLGRLVGGISHEINNPVTFISGNINHLREYVSTILNLIHCYQEKYPQSLPEINAIQENLDLDFIEEDSEKIFKSITVGTQRISQIVQSLRNFSRLDEEGIKNIFIEQAIETTLFILENRFKSIQSKHTLIVEKQFSQTPLVACYPAEINQVLMNLITNAIDAIEEVYKQQSQYLGCIQIVTTTIHENYLQIIIVDNGVGITPDIQGNVFDPFFTTKPVGKGTGMGLAICYQIVTEHHRGTLSCTSIPYTRTEFVVQIPIKQSLNSI